MSNDLHEHLKVVGDYVERSTHWQDGGATRHDAKIAIDHLVDGIDWVEKGLKEWQSVAASNLKQARAAQASARIAIAHLQAVLNTARTHAQQQAADTAARDWLISIGSEPT